MIISNGNNNCTCYGREVTTTQQLYITSDIDSDNGYELDIMDTINAEGEHYIDITILDMFSDDELFSLNQLNNTQCDCGQYGNRDYNYVLPDVWQTAFFGFGEGWDYPVDADEDFEMLQNHIIDILQIIKQLPTLVMANRDYVYTDEVNAIVFRSSGI